MVSYSYWWVIAISEILDTSAISYTIVFITDDVISIDDIAVNNDVINIGDIVAVRDVMTQLVRLAYDVSSDIVQWRVAA